MSASGTFDDKRYSKLAALGALLGIVSAGALFAAAIGYRAGFGEFAFVPPNFHWDYKFALGTINQYAAYGGLVAGVLGLIGLGATLPGGIKRGFVGALIAIVLGFGSAGQIGQLYLKVLTNPFIHDISTDTDNPPQFVDVVAAREAFAAISRDPVNGLEYTPDVASQQRGAQLRAGYPVIAPLQTAEPPAKVFEKVLALVEDEGWEVVAAVAEEGRIEATATTEYYRFRDDVVFRIKADGAGTRVDMRSTSRVGRSDLGTNAARIAAFMARLRVATGG